MMNVVIMECGHWYNTGDYIISGESVYCDDGHAWTTVVQTIEI